MPNFFFKSKSYLKLFGSNSDLDSADFWISKFIAKFSTDVATSALSHIIVLEVNCRARGRSFEVKQSAIDVGAMPLGR